MSKTHIPKVIAGEAAILARRYAAALYDLAHEKKAIDAVAADLNALTQVIDADPHFHVMATYPRLPANEIQNVIKKVVEKVKLHELTSAFLMQVARNRRLAYLGLMIDAFMADLAVKRGEYTAQVTVAKALSKDQEAKLSSQLGKMLAGTVKLVVEEDSSLIGGMIVRLGSRLIDASVKGKLARLERQLKTQQEAA
ncbi:MAG: ATP synthase F1 subunit delta [Alphaproteobacteria bacterium]|nr:ATP synthase F1 subunit delta [Alphaproteobacteria bacterium]